MIRIFSVEWIRPRARGLFPLEPMSSGSIHQPNASDAQLRFYWKGEDFPWEPLTGGHLQSTESAKDDALRSVRHQMAHLKCAACHLPQQAVSMPDALEKGPSLDGVGSRLQPAWMAQWIADPQSLRPQTHMPQVFRGKEGLQKAAHIAAFLSQQRAPIRRLGQGDATRGGHLFQALNCIGCHALEGEVPARTSLERVHQKYQPEPWLPIFRIPRCITPTRPCRALNFPPLKPEI